MEFLEKITAYPNEAIHDDCVVAFTGAYEKIANETQIKRVDVDRWYSTWQKLIYENTQIIYQLILIVGGENYFVK